MKLQEYGSLKGLTVQCLVFESYEEADKAGATAKDPHPMLTSGNDSLYYRGPAADVREKIVDLVEAKYGGNPSTKGGLIGGRRTKSTGKKDKDGADVLAFTESEGEYCNRVLGEVGKTDLTEFQPDINEWLKTANKKDENDPGSPLAVDITETERKSLPKKLAQVYIDTATKVFNNGNQNKIADKQNFAGTGTSVTYVEEPEDTTSPEFLAARTANITALGWAIKRHEAEKEKQKMQEYA